MELITQGRLMEFMLIPGKIYHDCFMPFYIMELLDKSLLDKMLLPDLYYHTSGGSGIYQPIGINLWIIRHFELQLLLNLELFTCLNSCVNCGSTELSAVNIAQEQYARLAESFRLYTRFCPDSGSTALLMSEAYFTLQPG